MKKRRRLRWGETFVAIAARFSAPRIRELRKDCYDFIDEAPDFPEMRKKGFRCSRYAFEKYGCLFLLWADQKAEEWVLDIVRLPTRKPRRRRPRGGDQANERAAVAALPASARRPRRSRLKRILFISYKKARGSAACRKLAAFWADASSRRGPESIMLAVNAINSWVERRRQSRPLSSSIVGMFNWLAGSLRHDAGTTMLVPKQFGGNLGFSLILNTYAPNGVGMYGSSPGELWPISLFGERDEGGRSA